MPIRIKHIHIVLWAIVAGCLIGFTMLRHQATAEAARLHRNIEWNGFFAGGRTDWPEDWLVHQTPDLCINHGLKHARVVYAIWSEAESNWGMPTSTTVDEIFEVHPDSASESVNMAALERDVWQVLSAEVIPRDAPFVEPGRRSRIHRHLSGELAVICAHIARVAIVISIALVFGWLVRAYLRTVRSDTRWMKGQCRDCGYQIDRLPVCPECGTLRE